ncbi:hypothetical protein DL93DRAFT_2143887 [Clavulina sp. PMI_390]|nr:hypothetical protein DL93DRAFT_2143887 [Clavulina sp. PMI_390]
MIRAFQHELVARPSPKQLARVPRRVLAPAIIISGSRRAYAKSTVLNITSYHPAHVGLANHTTWTQRREYASGPSSSNAPESSASINNGEPELPIPPASPTKARKVELRPAPVKHSATSSNPPPPPIPSTSASTSPESQTSSPSEPASASDTSSSPTTSTSTSSANSTAPPSTATSESPFSNPNNPLSSLIPPDSPTARILANAQADLRASESAGILAPPPPNASRVGKLFHQAKELFKFYARGLKMQWTHHKMVRAILARVSEEKKLGGKGEMTRWEAQFIRTHAQDLKKLVPFVLILIIVEEILPLIVIYAPFMLPSTTILPSQAERIYGKREEKKIQTLTTVKWYLERDGLLPATSKEMLSQMDVKTLGNDLAWTICRAFELSDRGPRAMVNRRLAKHLSYLAEDDALLRRESPNANLTRTELRNALSERGQLTDGMTADELRTRLDSWLRDENVRSGAHAALVGGFLQYAVRARIPDTKPTESATKSSESTSDSTTPPKA